jgi:AcrR family transcriptional regulator
MEPEPPDARRRLLEAAERLFREQGYDQVSVRAVNKAAGMNPAAVHYHFGSKEELATALLERRLRATWEGHLAEVEELLAAGDPPTASGIAMILVEPMARLAADPDGRWLLRLLARLVLARRELPWRVPWAASEPWIEMIAQALPGLPGEVVADRWRMARDLLLLTYGDPFAEPGGDPPPPPAAVAAFLAAGLAAPPPG